MFCSRCGLRLEEGARFCSACGQEVGFLPLPAPMAAGVPVHARLPYAGFWLRAAAYFIDGLILGIPFSLVMIILIFLLGGFHLMMRRSPLDPRDVAFAGPLILTFLFAMIIFVGLQWMYFAGMESSSRQATFGKATMSLRVTDLDGRQLTFGRATGRFFAKIVSGMIPLAIGYLLAGFTEKKQALHDMIAGTLVLRKL